MTRPAAYDPGRAARAVMALVRMAFGGRPETAPFEGMSEPDWNGAYLFASRQGVLSVAYDGTAGLPESLYPPQRLMLEWGVNASLAEERYAAQKAAVRQLAALYGEHSIEILLLKGYGLSLYYPVPEHRECGDADIYLFGEFDRGNRLAEEAGCKVDPGTGKHSSFVFKGTTVENHRVIVDENRDRRTAAIEAVLEDLASRGNLSKTAIDETRLWLPSPDFNAVYLVAHAASHFSNGEMLSVRNMCDWARFLTAEGKNIDRKFLNKTLKDSRFDTLCGLMTGFCERHLGLEPQGLPSPGRETEMRFDELIFRFRTLSPPDETFTQRARRIWRNRWRYREVMRTSFLSYLLYALRK